MAPDVARVADRANAMCPRTLSAIRVAALADWPAIGAGTFDAIDAIVMAARFGDAGASQQGKRERGRAEEAGHGWLRILWGFGCGAGEVGSAVIASEAKQSRLTCACASGGDCFAARRSGLPDLRMNS